MKINKPDVTITFTFDEAKALCTLTGGLTLYGMKENYGVKYKDGKIIQSMYKKLSETLPDDIERETE